MSEIKEPFLTVLRLGGSVDYKDKGGKTHQFIENMFACEQKWFCLEVETSIKSERIFWR